MDVIKRTIKLFFKLIFNCIKNHFSFFLCELVIDTNSLRDLLHCDVFVVEMNDFIMVRLFTSTTKYTCLKNNIDFFYFTHFHHRDTEKKKKYHVLVQ